MSQYTYTLIMSAANPLDISQIQRSDNIFVMWADADFQAWNSAQPTPFVLSAAQLQLKQLRALTSVQLGSATPSQLGFLLRKILDNLNTGVV